MIDVQQVRELIELMVEHGLSEVKVREGETTISLRKGGTGEWMYQSSGMPQMAPMAGGESPAVPAVPGPTEDEGLIPILSPMVGTFYSAPDPDSPAFVTVGNDVDAQTPVCIIEAMKVFNEIKAEVSGTIERILVHDQQAVEFGQPLMMVRPRK